MIKAPFDKAVIPSTVTKIFCDTIDTLSNILKDIFAFVATLTALLVGEIFVIVGITASIYSVVNSHVLLFVFVEVS